MKELNRLGPQEKCPACGWRLDADAYRCPKCMIYFCFKCRRRVAARDTQYQCLNQQCKYYGKLLCEVCTEAMPTYTKPYVKSARKKQDVKYYSGCWSGLGIVSAILGIAIWWFSSSFLIGLVGLGVVFGIGCIVARALGWRIFDDSELVTIEIAPAKEIPAKIDGYIRTYISCKQPVEVLHE